MGLIGVTLWAMLAVLVDVALARAAFGAFVPSIRADLGIDFAVAGVISSANAVGYLITSGLAPFITARIGARATAVAGHVLATLGFALSALAPSTAILVAMRVVSGLGGGAGMVAALRIALDAADPGRRIVVSTLAWAGAGVGLILAAFSVPWINDPATWRVATWVCAALALVIAVTTPRHVSAVTPMQTPAAAKAAAPVRYDWRPSTLIIAPYILFGIGFLAYSTFAAVAPSHAPPFIRFLSIGIMSIAGSLLVARTRYAERAMAVFLLFGALGSAFAFAGMPLGDIFFGIGLTAVPGLATAILRERADAHAVIQALALSTIAVGTGQFLGPLIAGIAAQRFGIAWAFGTAGAAYALGAVLVALDEITRRSPATAPERAVRL
jgi:MFS family permease